MGFYYKKMLVIEARRWAPAVVHTATPLIQWILDSGGTASFRCGRHCCYYELGISIETNQDRVLAKPGYWILKGIGQEFYALPDDVFKATYEEVTT